MGGGFFCWVRGEGAFVADHHAESSCDSKHPKKTKDFNFFGVDIKRLIGYINYIPTECMKGKGEWQEINIRKKQSTKS